MVWIRNKSLLLKDEVWSGMHPHLHAPRRGLPGTAAAARFTVQVLEVVISLILSGEERLLNLSEVLPFFSVCEKVLL